MKKYASRILIMILVVAMVCPLFAVTSPVSALDSTATPIAYIITDGVDYYEIVYQDLFTSYLNYRIDPYAAASKLAKFYFDTLAVDSSTRMVAYQSSVTMKFVKYSDILSQFVQTRNLNTTYIWFNSDSAAPAFASLTTVKVLDADGNVSATALVGLDGKIVATEVVLAAFNNAPTANDMATVIATYGASAGLVLANYTALINKKPVLNSMVSTTFVTIADIKTAFDSFVDQEIALESSPMVVAFNNAPDAATMANVISLYESIFNPADFSIYSTQIGPTAQAEIQTAMLTPLFSSAQDINMSFVLNLINIQYILYAQQVYDNNLDVLGLSTGLPDNTYDLLSANEKILIYNAIFAARPLTDQAQLVVIAMDTTTVADYIGTLLTINGTLLDLDLTAYNGLTLEQQNTMHEVLMAATLTSVADVQAVFNAEMTILTYVPAVGSATARTNTSAIICDLTTGSFDPIAGIAIDNWTIGGNDLSDLGTITGVVLSNNNQTATITLSGTIGLSPKNYTVMPAQAAMAIGFAGPPVMTVTLLDPYVSGSAVAVTGTSTITCKLTSGLFDPTAGIEIGNWTLGGTDSLELGNITDVVLSNNNQTATITVSGTIGVNPRDYTIEPAQAIFTPNALTAPPAPLFVMIRPDTLAVASSTAIGNSDIIIYTLTTGTFDPVAGVMTGNWTLGGPFAGDLGTLEGVVLSNGNTTAALVISGIVWTNVNDYTVAPAQAAFSTGFGAPDDVVITVLEPRAAGSAAATTGAEQITYKLTLGTFDPDASATLSNWTLGGPDANDLGNITGVVLSNNNKTATISVSGTVGSSQRNYTILAAQAIFTPGGYTAPAATPISVISDTLSVGNATAVKYESTIVYTLTTGTFDPDSADNPGSWSFGGDFTDDLGTIQTIVLSNGNTTATLTISGVVWPDTPYLIEPAQAAFAAGFDKPSPVTVSLLDPMAVGSATAVTGSRTITYDLSVGLFDSIIALDVTNWTLGGTDLGDLGTVTGIVLSNGDKTATLTITGLIGASPKNYIVTPNQTMFTLWQFGAPEPVTVSVTP